MNKACNFNLKKRRKNNEQTKILLGILLASILFGILIIGGVTFSIMSIALILAEIATHTTFRHLLVTHLLPLVIGSITILVVGIAITKVFEKKFRDLEFLEFLARSRALFITLIILIVVVYIYILRGA